MTPSGVPRPEVNCWTNATISEALRDRGRLGCAGFARLAAIVTPRQKAELHKQHTSYTSKWGVWQQRDSGSRDVTGRRAGGLVVPPQIVHPRRGHEAAGGVRLDQQLGHLPPHLHGLLRR